MTKNIGGPVGPFNEGQSVFDFLDEKVLNQIAKALASYKGLSAVPPLQIQRTPNADSISLGQRIDSFNLVELQEDLVEDTSATAFILRRDVNDDLVVDSNLPLEVWDSDIAVGGAATKRFNKQRGIAFLNPYSKNPNWEFLSLEIQQGGTIINNSNELVIKGTDDLVIGDCSTDWVVFPFETVLGSTPGLDFTFSGNTIAVTGKGPLKLSYKIYVYRIGLNGKPSDDAIEVKISVDDKNAGGFIDIPASYTIGLIDDVDRPCVVNPDVRKQFYEGTASCPTFYYNSLDGDVFRVEVRRKAGNETFRFPPANAPVSGDTGEASEAKCSFFTFEQNR